MTTFEITAPDGKTYEVTGPEGSTKEQALEKVKAQHGQSVQGAGKTATEPTTGSLAAQAAYGLGEGLISGVGSVADVMSGTAFARPIIDVAAGPEVGKAVAPRGSESLHAPLPDVANPEKNLPQNSAEKFVRTPAEFLGNPLSWGGPGGVLAKGAAAVASGAASEAAGQATEGTKAEPYVRAGTAMAVGGLSGLATRPAGQALPTREQIKAAGTAGYEQLKQSNVQVAKDAVSDLLTGIKADLHRESFRDYLAPSTYRAIEELKTGKDAKIADIDGVRRLLGNIPGTNPTDKAAAQRAVSAIDEFLNNPPPGSVLSGSVETDAAILKHAQGNWRSQKQLEVVENASVGGQRRAGVSGSGANRINTARQEIRKILDSDKKSRGMSDEVKAKMEEIVMGTWGTNTARRLGKFAPSGPVSATTSILTGLGAGAPAGAAVGIGGYLAKHLGEYLTDRQIKQLENLIRAESPIGRPIARANAAQAATDISPLLGALRSGAASPLAAGQQ